MANNKISGSYILQSALKIADYEFTGTNRNATVSISNKVINLIDLSNGSINNNFAFFRSENRIHIKAIRIVTPGGEGLRSCSNAATLTLNVYEASGTYQNKGILTKIQIEKYNEWQKIDELLEPYKLIDLPTFLLGFSSGTFNIDDYNIQEKYIGEKVEFYIDFELFTSGIYLDGKIV